MHKHKLFRAAMKLYIEGNCITAQNHVSSTDKLSVYVWVKPNDVIADQKYICATDLVNGFCLGQMNKNVYLEIWQDGIRHWFLKSRIRPNVWSLIGFIFFNGKIRIYHNRRMVGEAEVGSPIIKLPGVISYGCASYGGFMYTGVLADAEVVPDIVPPDHFYATTYIPYKAGLTADVLLLLNDYIRDCYRKYNRVAVVGPTKSAKYFNYLDFADDIDVYTFRSIPHAKYDMAVVWGLEFVNSPIGVLKKVSNITEELALAFSFDKEYSWKLGAINSIDWPSAYNSMVKAGYGVTAMDSVTTKYGVIYGVKNAISKEQLHVIYRSDAVKIWKQLSSMGLEGCPSGGIIYRGFSFHDIDFELIGEENAFKEAAELIHSEYPFVVDLIDVSRHVMWRTRYCMDRRIVKLHYHLKTDETETREYCNLVKFVIGDVQA
ncbi:MAG: hypothetical protein JZD41_02290 [Thermoproteus sp.]|nr:hypothetical protein [Thermoproteus sp.]